MSNPTRTVRILQRRTRLHESSWGEAKNVSFYLGPTCPWSQELPCCLETPDPVTEEPIHEPGFEQHRVIELPLPPDDGLYTIAYIPSVKDGENAAPAIQAALNAAHDAAPPAAASAEPPFDGVWRCSSCGKLKDSDGSWRWMGTGWEHRCSGEPRAGYFKARYLGPTEEGKPSPALSPDVARLVESLDPLISAADQAYIKWRQFDTNVCRNAYIDAVSELRARLSEAWPEIERAALERSVARANGLSPDVSRLVEELDALEKKATPGPWHYGFNPDGYDPIDYFRDAYSFGPPGRVHLTCIPAPGKDVNDEALFTSITGNGPTSEANAQLIAAMRNALPALSAALRQAAAQQEEHESDLRDAERRASKSEDDRVECESNCSTLRAMLQTVEGERDALKKRLGEAEALIEQAVHADLESERREFIEAVSRYERREPQKDPRP